MDWITDYIDFVNSSAAGKVQEIPANAKQHFLDSFKHLLEYIPIIPEDHYDKMLKDDDFLAAVFLYGHARNPWDGDNRPSHNPWEMLYHKNYNLKVETALLVCLASNGGRNSLKETTRLAMTQECYQIHLNEHTKKKNCRFSSGCQEMTRLTNVLAILHLAYEAKLPSQMNILWIDGHDVCSEKVYLIACAYYEIRRINEIQERLALPDAWKKDTGLVWLFKYRDMLLAAAQVKKHKKKFLGEEYLNVGDTVCKLVRSLPPHARFGLPALVDECESHLVNFEEYRALWYQLGNKE